MTTKGIMRRAGALLAPTVIALLLVVCQPEDDGGGGERASVATLNALTLSAGATTVALTPTPFDPETTGYSASVANSVGSVTVTATTTDGEATLTIDGTPATSGVASGAIELTAGDDTQIDIVVTAEDTTATETYTITVRRAPQDASSVATLNALTLSDGALNPTFDPETTGYSALVANTVASVTVTATTTDGEATLTIDGTPATSGVASGAIAVMVGDTQIDIVVTAEDAATRKTYTITVTRAPPDASSDATLNALTLSAGGATVVTLTPTPFDPETMGYSALVANSVESVTVTATATSGGATLTIDMASATSGTASGAIELTANGDTQIDIGVTAEDAMTTATYTITVTRAPRDASSVATLSALTLSNGATPVTLSPAFAGDTMGYSALVANTVASVMVTAMTTDDGATLTIAGASATSGTASGAIALRVGATQIDIVVTAEDATTRKTYTIEVERADVDTDSDGVFDSPDVDDDNDGLIEINTLEDLDYVRHNLAGTSRKTSAGDSGAPTRAGAPTASTDDCDTATDGVYLCGYELARSLDFAQSGSYADGAVNSDWRPTGGNPATATNAGFVPIGDNDTRDKATRFVAIFEGNGFTIRNLYVNKSGQYVGLFGYTEGSAIARLGLPDATVRASEVTDINQYVGALVGFNDRGSIELCYSTGLVSGSGNSVGGLVGNNFNTGATIAASYSSSAVSGDTGVGGLVGNTNDGSVIVASYATGAVSGSGSSVGGLVGISSNIINASYATGGVSGVGRVGGLVGSAIGSTTRNSWASGTVMASAQDGDSGGLVGSFILFSPTIIDGYWDSETTGQTTSVGEGTGLATAQMQAAGGSSFSDGFRDDCGGPFDFRGAGEAARYPRLKLLTAGGDTSDCSDDVYHASELLGGQ